MLARLNVEKLKHTSKKLTIRFIFLVRDSKPVPIIGMGFRAFWGRFWKIIFYSS